MLRESRLLPRAHVGLVPRPCCHRARFNGSVERRPFPVLTPALAFTGAKILLDGLFTLMPATAPSSSPRRFTDPRIDVFELSPNAAVVDLGDGEWPVVTADHDEALTLATAHVRSR